MLIIYSMIFSHFYTVQYNREVNAIAYIQLLNGKWTKPKLVSFSGEYEDLEPVFHPDGKRLFSTSQCMSKNMTSGSYTYKDLLEWHNQPKNGNGDIYWMDAGFIEELRKQ